LVVEDSYEIQDGDEQ